MLRKRRSYDEFRKIRNLNWETMLEYHVRSEKVGGGSNVYSLDDIRKQLEQDPEISEIIQAFQEIDNVYQEALLAMGLIGKTELRTANSAEIVVSFDQPLSTASSV